MLTSSRRAGAFAAAILTFTPLLAQEPPAPASVFPPPSAGAPPTSGAPVRTPVSADARDRAEAPAPPSPAPPAPPPASEKANLKPPREGFDVSVFEGKPV